MAHTDPSRPPSAARGPLLLGVAVGLLLVGNSLRVAPATSIVSLAAASVALLLYGLAIAVGLPRSARRDPRLTRDAVRLGLLAGAIFVIEIALEYLLLPRDNSGMGLIEFGLVFALYLGAGWRAARRGGSLRDSMIAALWTAVIGSLIWLIGLLATFYLFYGTPRQALVLRAEGDYDDFARSGAGDLSTFLMEDMLGAGFFHLLLGPLLAALLGGIGGAAGRARRRA